MPMTAVICANVQSSDLPGVSRAQLSFAGQSVLEYQVRQVAGLGIAHVIVLVDAVTPVLSRTVDRMMGEGVRVQLIRDMPTLMREVPRDGDMLLIVDGAIAGQEHLEALAAAAGSAVLVVEDSGTMEHLERIDGIHRWCGVAKIAPDVVFATLDLIGDWDFSSTLMRAAVQANAKRIAVPQNDVLEGRVALVDRQAAADLVAQAVLAGEKADGPHEPGSEYYLFAPLAHRLSARFVRMQVPSSQLRLAAIGISLIGMLALVPDWPFLSLLALICARIADLSADQIDVLARRRHAAGWLRHVTLVVLLAGITLVGRQYGVWEASIYLVAIAAVVHYAARASRKLVAEPWSYATPGSALLMMGIGMLTGQVAAVLFAGNLLAIGSVARLLLRDRSRAAK